MITIAAEAGDAARVAPPGTLLVTATARRDLDTLLDVCRQCMQPADSTRLLDSAFERWEPLRAFYATLLVGRIESGSDTGVARRSWVEGVAQRFSARGGDAFDALILALASLANAWSEQDDDAQYLHVAVASPLATTARIEVVFPGPTASLVLQPGSLVASFNLGAEVRSEGWLALVIAKVTRLARPTAQAAANELIEDSRMKAGSTARRSLRRLDQLKGPDLHNVQSSPVVLVLLHGLYSTDLGTFDGFIERLHDSNPLTLLPKIDSAMTTMAPALGGHDEGLIEIRQRLQSRVEELTATHPETAEAIRSGQKPEMLEAVLLGIPLVGWPHNTLTAIDVNAGELADLLERTFLPRPPRLIFVCHSRGGLVARAAIVKLLALEDRGSIWRSCLAGLVTFGTPHDGASIAEQPLRNLATYLLVARSTGQAASLSKVLAYLGARTAEGIEQLKPVQATTPNRPIAFTEQLYALERDLVRDRSARRFPPTIAIGGVLDDNAQASWSRAAASALVTRWLANTKHDLVVELQSSVSARLAADVTVEVPCDHFRYFEAAGPEHDLAADLALALVWSQLNFNETFFYRPAKRARYLKKGTLPAGLA